MDEQDNRPGRLERFSLRIIRVLAGSLEANGGACEGSCTSPAKPDPTKESCKAKAAALDHLRWNCVVSLPHSLVLMEDGRGTATALYGGTTQPSPTMWPAHCHLGMARPAVPRPQKPGPGETDDLQNYYGFLASADRSPSKKGMLSGLPDSSAQDQAAWPSSPIQIGRVFAHRHPGRRQHQHRGRDLGELQLWPLFTRFARFVSDLIHERSVAIVSGLRLSVVFDSVKSKLSELVAAQAIPPI